MMKSCILYALLENIQRVTLSFWPRLISRNSKCLSLAVSPADLPVSKYSHPMELDVSISSTISNDSTISSITVLGRYGFAKARIRKNVDNASATNGLKQIKRLHKGSEYSPGISWPE